MFRVATNTFGTDFSSLITSLIAFGRVLKRPDAFERSSKRFRTQISHVLCTEKKIGLELPGKQFFGARIFASHHEDDPDCVRHYASTDKVARFELPTRDLPCGMKFKRLSYPKSGLEYTLDVIVSYSHMHMTQDDQMFSLTCRSTAFSIPVGTVMEISTYSTTYLTDEPKVPTCEYSLHLGSVHGPIATNAQLGNKVFHEWKCNTENFAIKIYECYVHDGGNRRYLIIDEHGCSVDETIMPQLTYDANLNFVYVHSRVFKFSDSSKMLFKCLIYMCPKKDPRCRQTIPPQCNDRSKRFINETSSEDSTLIYNSVEIEADPFEDPSQSN
uniref:ZP domain-containing protein n=1 Tax=Acrobeloides nanus TaxID=290746 RepID=A0A914DEN8_9BILA